MKAVPDMIVEHAPQRISGAAHAFALRDSDDDLDAGLAIARKHANWTFVALPAPIVAAPGFVAAWRHAPVVAWSSQALTIVGIGAALELRGTGVARWREIIAEAARIEASAILDRSGASDRGMIKPRLLGGVAFAPGAADAAPWTGFGDAWFMLPRWTYVHDGARAALVLAVDARDAQHAGRWRDELDALRSALAAGFAPRPQPPLVEMDPGDRDAWRAQVRAITDAIRAGECAKIVAARSAVVTLAGEARVADMLAELDARHADCVRVLVQPPGGGSLVAATPERLVALDGTAVACDALAGSIARVGDRDAGELRASAKDRNEHEIVVHAIASALRALDADVRFPVEPGVRTLRHVLHLHTPIAATLRTRRHVLELAAALHPTPAVGGTPTQIATDWIAAHEVVPRGWYAAPVGWFDLDGNGELAVAIRSGLVAGERAHLWAGAGIVAGSDPDRELAETDLKLRAMLGALGVTA
ncbi:MAG TPA: isochorismate synthase [Kofleriaceae bacterium]